GRPWLCGLPGAMTRQERQPLARNLSFRSPGSLRQRRRAAASAFAELFFRRRLLGTKLRGAARGQGCPTVPPNEPDRLALDTTTRPVSAPRNGSRVAASALA